LYVGPGITNALVAFFILQAFIYPVLGVLTIWAENVSVHSGPHLSDLGLLASIVLAAVFVMAGIYRIGEGQALGFRALQNRYVGVDTAGSGLCFL